MSRNGDLIRDAVRRVNQDQEFRTLMLPKRLKPRTRITAVEPFVAASPTATFLLPNTVNPPTSTWTPSGTSTSMSPNGATALMVILFSGVVSHGVVASSRTRRRTLSLSKSG